MLTLFLAAALAQAAAAQSAGRTSPSPLAPSEIVAAAPVADWVAIPPADLLVMDLAPDAAGKPRRVVIQLMPAPFAQGWIVNIRTLAAAHWWDGTSVNRVQDNYVAQWGDATEKKALPAGLRTMTEGDYTAESPFDIDAIRKSGRAWQDVAARTIRTGFIASGVEPEPPSASGDVTVGMKDRYAKLSFDSQGWPIAGDGERYWPVHCYGMVGVGRNLSPDTGSGAELYTVIGHAPRHLDRNIALVGRVVEGIEHLSSLPRGTEALGFYKTAAERTPIRSIRLASDLPAAGQPRFEYLSTESATFARYADARANRRDAFFIRPAGGADICNVPVPVRRVK